VDKKDNTSAHGFLRAANRFSSSSVPELQWDENSMVKKKKNRDNGRENEQLVLHCEFQWGKSLKLRHAMNRA
jgi:hypothetical protein